MSSRIVVGVDGSEGSEAALRWALDEARRRECRLDLVHVWHVPYAGEVSGLVMGELSERLEHQAREVVQSVMEKSVGEDPGVEVVPMVTEGATAEALLDAARDADLLVVGSRGLGGFKSLLLGSVSTACVHHATCPVVVVPG